VSVGGDQERSDQKGKNKSGGARWAAQSSDEQELPKHNQGGKDNLLPLSYIQMMSQTVGDVDESQRLLGQLEKKPDVVGTVG